MRCARGAARATAKSFDAHSKPRRPKRLPFCLQAVSSLLRRPEEPSPKTDGQALRQRAKSNSKAKAPREEGTAFSAWTTFGPPKRSCSTRAFQSSEHRHSKSFSWLTLIPSHSLNIIPSSPALLPPRGEGSTQFPSPETGRGVRGEGKQHHPLIPNPSPIQGRREHTLPLAHAKLTGEGPGVRASKPFHF